MNKQIITNNLKTAQAIKMDTLDRLHIIFQGGERIALIEYIFLLLDVQKRGLITEFKDKLDQLDRELSKGSGIGATRKSIDILQAEYNMRLVDSGDDENGVRDEPSTTVKEGEKLE